MNHLQRSVSPPAGLPYFKVSHRTAGLSHRITKTVSKDYWGRNALSWRIVPKIQDASIFRVTIYQTTRFQIPSKLHNYQAVSHWLPSAPAGSGHLGFVVDKVALEQVFSEYFGFPCQSSFHQLLRNHHHHLWLVQ
jgi:hypothetical protein